MLAKLQRSEGRFDMHKYFGTDFWHPERPDDALALRQKAEMVN
jgi:hypothetical protein